MKQTAAEISTVKPVSRDHCHESPPVMKDHIFLASEPTFQRNWTCCQRPSVLRDNILWLMGRSFKAGSTVVKYRLKIICQLQQLLKWMDMYIHTYACLELRGCIIRTTDHSSAAWVTNFIVCPCVLKSCDCSLQHIGQIKQAAGISKLKAWIKLTNGNQIHSLLCNDSIETHLVSSCHIYVAPNKHHKYAIYICICLLHLS